MHNYPKSPIFACDKDITLMEKAKDIASYISIRYQKEFGKRIDEMKLHKLLYFAQREALVQLDEPLFPERFEAWKYGPVLVPIRHLYQEKLLTTLPSEQSIHKFAAVFDKVFAQYAVKDSWSLSTLTHEEYSWKQAKQNVPDGENCSNEMDIEDIRQDARRIRARRLLLKALQLRKE